MIDFQNVKLIGAEQMIDHSTVMDIVACICGVQEFFKDETKTSYWMNTPNPNLGGLIPMSMILLGRGYKIKQFIEAAQKGNLG